MVNEVNKLIYNTLAEHRAIHLSEVGSLSIARRKAKMERNRVVAPSFVVEFSSAQQGVSLTEVIASKANISTTEAKDIYLRWLDKVREDNKLTISGVGTLKDKAFITDGTLLKALNLGSSAPLKVHSRSRMPYLLIAAVGFIALCAGAYLYLISDRVATPAVEEPSVVAVIETPEPAVEEVIEEEEIIAEPEPTRWIDSDDIRHWVVVGSYSTRENAERAVEDLLGKQMAEYCDILTLGKMYAVAVYGSSDKAECERFVRDNRHMFKQSWVHTPKRFK